MPKITFLKPIDQPTGKQRLLHELEDHLKSPHYTHFKLAVGFVKVGPLARLAVSLREWKKAKKLVEGIFGIDLFGTSMQAIEFALAEFDKTYITRVGSSMNSTFHPKLYIFYGEKLATGFYGSHNLTVGGTETNFEGGVKLEFDRLNLADELTFQELLECWNSLLPDKCAATELLTQSLFDSYVRAGLLLDERRPSHPSSALPINSITKPTTPKFKIKPPSSLPKEVLPAKNQKSTKTTKDTTISKIPMPISAIPSRALVIQIIPHHNGEIFLSKSAINQDPDFFEFPFLGKTVPKKSSNKSYPQRIPDPRVNITVYDQNGSPMPHLSRQYFPLNMVYYEVKSEIRITVNPELSREIPAYSILVMSRPEEQSDYDYVMDIYCTGSDQFKDYLGICNQTLPSGGAEKPRLMGWL
jgi:HKD family nuclease